MLRHESIKYWGIVFLILSSASVSTAKAADQTRRLRLVDVLQIVETNSPTIDKAGSRIIEMKETKDVALAGYLPSLGLQSTVSSNEFVLNQKLYDGGATLASIELARQNTQLAEADKKVQSEKVRNIATEAYYNALFAANKVKFFEQNDRTLSDALERAEKQFKYRAIGRDALLRAKVEYRKIRSESFEAKNAERESVHVLSRLTRIPDFSSGWLVDSFDTSHLPKPLSPDELMQAGEAFGSRPEVERLQVSEKALNAEKNYDLASDRPNISFAASYGLSKTAPAFSVGYTYVVGVQYGFAITIPLTSEFSAYSKRRVYEERHFQIEQDINTLRSDFDFEYREKIDLLNQAWNDLQSIAQELKASEAIWKEANANFKIGLSSPELWFEATENVQEWRLRQLQKVRTYLIDYQAVSSLSRAKGDIRQ